MKKIFVLDSHALLVFLEKEKGYEKIKAILAELIKSDKYLLMSAVNFGEVIYMILRECGEEKMVEIETIINDLPIKIIDADYALAKDAAQFKAFRKMSYADCFAAALAKKFNGEIITGDPEFKEVEKEIAIRWI